MPTSRRDRPVTRRIGAAVAAGVVALALGGCVGAPSPTPTPSASASAEPIFASDEEALAAAEAAYRAYSRASAQITGDAGHGPERVEAFVTADFAATLYEEFAAFETNGVRSEGEATFDHASLVEWDQLDRTASVTIYLCRDITNVRILGPDSVDVTPAGRQQRVPSQAFFVSSAGSPSTLLVDGIEKWDGSDFC